MKPPEYLFPFYHLDVLANTLRHGILILDGVQMIIYCFDPQFGLSGKIEK